MEAKERSTTKEKITETPGTWVKTEEELTSAYNFVGGFDFQLILKILII